MLTKPIKFKLTHLELVGFNTDLLLFSPAPAFTAEAVVDGDFKSVSLSDYKGK